MADGVRALVGTRKGLWVLTRAGDPPHGWEVVGPLLGGWGVYHAVVDPRDGTLFAATNHIVYGPTVQRSIDDGATWTRCEQLTVPGREETVTAAWHVAPGPADQPGTLYLGAAPGLLFRSDDHGHSWQVNEAILDHPTRGDWVPTAGGLACHTVQLDPMDQQRIFLAFSAAGTFRSDDGGHSWAPRNQDVEIDMLPNPYPEAGQCVHKLLQHQLRPSRLWQQTHCGVYRSDDAGDSWERVDGNGLPSVFGYPLMLDPADPDVAYVIPHQGYEYHWATDGRLRVFRTTDAGGSWESLSDGLPHPAWTAVAREASAYDHNSLYFGTQSGSFFTRGRSGNWVEAARHLPAILSVEVTPWLK